MKQRIPHRESGFALISAVILLVSLTLLAVTMNRRVTANEHMAANQRDLINAMAVAESGIEAGYATIKNQYVDHEKQIWKDSLFAIEGNSLAVGSVSGGDYTVTLDHITETDGAVAVILNSTGEYRGSSREIEIILELSAGLGGRYAILAQDWITFPGNPYIYGPYADVHSNTGITISGNPEITGNVSSTGGIDISGNPVLGGQNNGAPQVDIPYIYPPEYKPYHTILFTPDCKVKDASGNVLADASDDKWHGWDCSPGDKWTMSSSDSDDMYDAFYYVEGNVVLSGSPEDSFWYATFVVEGYLEVSGNGWFKPWGTHPDQTTGNEIADNILYWAGNDLKINGNPEQKFYGVIATHMDIQVSGNPYFEASIVAENGLYHDGQEVRSGQEVKNIVDNNQFNASNNEFNGNMVLNSSGATPLHAAKKLTVTAWRELVTL